MLINNKKEARPGEEKGAVIIIMLSLGLGDIMHCLVEIISYRRVLHFA